MSDAGLVLGEARILKALDPMLEGAINIPWSSPWTLSPPLWLQPCTVWQESVWLTSTWASLGEKPGLASLASLVGDL